MKDQTEFDPYFVRHLQEGHSHDVARALAQADWQASHRPDEVPAGESSELSEHVRYAPITSPAPGETLRVEVNR